MTSFTEAQRLTELGNELSAAGRQMAAEAAYQSAAKASPGWWVPWYDLGLLYKYQGRWTESLAMNRRAAELEGADQAPWWNLGIAATALGQWAEARRAWRVCGLTIPDGEGPPELDFGLVPIRLDPDGQGEVVWANRIDPARARIASVPLPTSIYRWEDLVLHDGAPEGHRMLRGHRRGPRRGGGELGHLHQHPLPRVQPRPAPLSPRSGRVAGPPPLGRLGARCERAPGNSGPQARYHPRRRRGPLDAPD